MALFKRAHIRGMVHEMTRRGLVRFPTKLAEEESADAIADALPEEVVPEVTPEDGLTPEQAQAALQQIVEVAEEIAARSEAGEVEGQPPMPMEDTQKMAAATSYEDAASHAALSLMHKAAEETAVATGPDIPGPTPPAPDLSTTAEGEVDAKTTPSADIVVPQGTTEVDTAPGAVGKEEVRAEQPGAEGSPPTGEAAKTAAPVSMQDMLLTLSKHGYLNKEAMSMDGASLSGGAAGGPAPTPRVDLDDNLKIPGAVAPSQGQTSQDVPAAADVGATKKQPAGTPGPTDATPNKPAKDAVKEAMDLLKKSESGQALLRKLAEEMKEDEKKEESDEEKEEKKEKDEEAEKEAQVLTALQNLATVLE